jgi:hypothetical protein
MGSDSTFLGRHALLPHATSPVASVQELSVTLSRPEPDSLELRYTLLGHVGELKLPEPRPSVRADGLWRHSCFEAFIGHSSGPDYWEYNFSPSGAWAAYRFAARREGMAPLMKGAPPALAHRVDGGRMEVNVTLDLSWLVRTHVAEQLKLGVAAVIEDRAGVLSYWALSHPAEKPDFHHPDSFVLRLD